jgi:hypothetical protein
MKASNPRGVIPKNRKDQASIRNGYLSSLHIFGSHLISLRPLLDWMTEWEIELGRLTYHSFSLKSNFPLFVAVIVLSLYLDSVFM